MLLHVWQEHIICYTSAHTSIHACMPWCMQHLWVHSPVRHALCMAPQRVSHPTESRGGLHLTKNNAVVADTCASHMQFVPLLKITLTLPPSRSDCQHSTLHRFHSSGSVNTVQCMQSTYCSGKHCYTLVGTGLLVWKKQEARVLHSGVQSKYRCIWLAAVHVASSCWRMLGIILSGGGIKCRKQCS